MTDQEIKELVDTKLLKNIRDYAIQTVLRRVLYYDKNKIDWQDFYENMKAQMPELTLGESSVRETVNKILEGADVRRTLAGGLTDGIFVRDLILEVAKREVSFEVYSQPDSSLSDEGGWNSNNPSVDIFVDGKKVSGFFGDFNQPVIVTCYPGSVITFSRRGFVNNKWEWVESGTYSFIVPDDAKGKAVFCVEVFDVMGMDIGYRIKASECKGWAKDVI